MSSNLSRIKPKLRTEGALSGNFGRAKVRSGSYLNDLGNTTAEIVRIADRASYVARMISIVQDQTVHPKTRRFAYEELQRLNAFVEKRLGPEVPCKKEWMKGLQ